MIAVVVAISAILPILISPPKSQFPIAVHEPNARRSSGLTANTRSTAWIRRR